jgi:carbon monoxide dehydrogenase subunit G
VRRVATTIDVEITIPAAVETVWDDLADVASHSEWMTDAARIDFVGEQRSGVGTTIAVLTKVGPISLRDQVEFVAWRPPYHMAIRHRGLVTGDGSFVLSPEGDGTRFSWSERLDFPLRMGGVLGELVAAPILRAIWRRNLEKLRTRFV